MTCFLFVCASSIFSFGQELDYNLQDDFIAGGYDVVAYFSDEAVEGKKEFLLDYDGASFLFSSQKNLDTFKSDPSRYMPQYGGWCAYAMSVNAEKVTINPKTFEIRGGKLFLFYNAFFNNTLTSWKKEGPEQLKLKADQNWEKLKFKL